MDNNQFRKLLSDTPGHQNDGSPSSRPGATPAFGAKRASFMPMTPRTVKSGVDVDFARQVRERDAALQPTKKFKSSAAPKGTKFAKGYTDRARAREEAGDGEDDRAARIKALEEQMKLGQISMEMFESLRDQITGGEASSTHLVKGLDRKLLERVRRGEDVLGVGGAETTAQEPNPDVDEELDKLGEKEVEAVKREKAEKKGMMAPPPLAGKKRSRNEIMAELKAQREAAAKAKAATQLDARWRKVGEKEKSRIEIDHKGREVLITVDEDGVVKKKVRKLPASVAEDVEEKQAFEMPDAGKAVLGADAVLPDVPVAPALVEDEDDDIFEGVGTEYNPLGDTAGDEDSDEDSDEHAGTVAKPQQLSPTSNMPGVAAPATDDSEDEGEISETEPPRSHEKPEEPRTVAEVTSKPPVRHSYFTDNAKTTEETQDHFAGIQNVLKKAAQLGQSKETADDDAREGESEAAHQARIKRRAQMLAKQDRDLEDMDMGFGSSRLEDEADADEEGMKIKLSEWKQGRGADGDDDDGGKVGKEKKKRKPKKRKGDVNNAADVMRVIEGRKAK